MSLVAMPSSDQRFRDFVEAARYAPFYRSWLETGHAISTDSLSALPRVTIRQLEEHPEEFRNCRSRQEKPRAFHYPLEHEPKIAMLAEGFRTTSKVRDFSDFTMEELRDLQADTFAAPLPLVRELARTARPQRYPIVVFTGPRHGYLTDVDRDLFWKAFGVPCFEQLTGMGGEVLAEECQAHEGLHLRAADGVFEVFRGELLITSLTRLEEPIFRLSSGLYGHIIEGACPCGRTSPRIVQEARKALAMSA